MTWRRDAGGAVRRAAVRPRLSTRLLAAALAAVASASTGLVVASADAGGKAGRHHHHVAIAVPLGGVDRLRKAIALPELGRPPTDEPGLNAPTPPTPPTPLRTSTRSVAPRHAPAPRVAATAALPATGAPPAPAPPTPTREAPDIVLIPPAALPAPAVIKPAAGGLSAGPLVGLGLGLVMLAGLLGLRLARRPG